MNINITTLTPVHIGNGTELQGNTEYLYFDKEKKIAIIDAMKVLTILGEDRIGDWVACIEKNEPLLPLLKTHRPTIHTSDVGLRSIPLSIGTSKPIREHIHRCDGKALVPGSSLKGAIRTTVWADTIFENENMARDRRNLGNTDQRGGFRWSDSFLNKTFFGNDPNHDIFRLLQVGDATFTKTEVYQTDVVNKYGDNWRIKPEITQFVEAISVGEEATLRLNHNDILKSRSQETFNKNAEKLKLSELFPLMNNHTKRLVDDEIAFWDDKEGNPTVMGIYVDEMLKIQEAIDTCTKNECVLRIGWGSGFRSMTGDWHGIMNDDDYFNLIKSLRPKHPEDLMFPKTTRFIKGGMPLGFIKLSY